MGLLGCDGNGLADVDYVSCHLGELQFEFLELSDQFEHQVKAVGLQLKIMVTKPVSIQ